MTVEQGPAFPGAFKPRTGYPLELFQRLERWGVGKPGQHLCDLGTGSGMLARPFAEQGCHVFALDASELHLERARALAATAGLRVSFRTGHAEETGLPMQSFDVVTAGQCWPAFDRPRAAAEVRRILVPGGAVVLVMLEWIALPGSVVEATEFILHSLPDAPRTPAEIQGHAVGVYPAFFHDLAMAGFVGLESFTFDCALDFSHESWKARVRASPALPAAGPEGEGVRAQFDRELETVLRRKFPSPQLSIPHRVFAVMGRSPLAA